MNDSAMKLYFDRVAKLVGLLGLLGVTGLAGLIDANLFALSFLSFLSDAAYFRFFKCFFGQRVCLPPERIPILLCSILPLFAGFLVQQMPVLGFLGFLGFLGYALDTAPVPQNG